MTACHGAGPDASCIDRLLQTDRLEYLDRDDVDEDEEAQRDPGARVDRRGVRPDREVRARSRSTKWLTCPIPGSSSSARATARLSRKLLEWHPTAQLTVTDIELPSVQAMADGDLGEHPRATVREMDATAIDVADRHFDLAVFALAFHHLPPSLASEVIAEGTRVADKLLIIDLPRPPWPLHLLRLATMLPFAPWIPMVHDGVISSLRTYSPSALRALAAHADPSIDIELRGGLISAQVAVASSRLLSPCSGGGGPSRRHARSAPSGRSRRR